MSFVKKRVLPVLLAVSMLLSMALTASAADSPALRASVGTITTADGSETILPGDTILVPIEITENPGTAALNVGVSYDSDVLKCIDVAKGGIYGMYATEIAADKSEVRIVTIHTENSTATGTYATLKFEVAADAAVASSVIRLYILDGDDGNCSDENADVVPYEFTDGTVKIEIPTPTTVEVSGPNEVEVPTDAASYTAVVTDQFGEVMENQNVVWSVQGDEGVSIGQDGTLSVDKTVQSGSATITAECGEAAGTKTVTITRPSAVVSGVTVSGADTAAVPEAASGDKTLQFEAEAIDQFETVIPGADVTWSVSDAQGVSIDQNGVLTITSKAAAGEVTVTADVGGVSGTKTVTITKAASVAASLSFKDGDSATVSIPTGDTPNTKTFDVVVLDQYGDEMDANVTYTLRGGAGVSADGNTVTVTKEAEENGVYTLTAKSGSVSASIAITAVSIEVEWPEVTVRDNSTYGTVWSQVVSLQGGSASVDGVNVPGTFTLDNANEAPDAGEQTYTIQFVSDDGAYQVTTSGTAVIAQKELTAVWSGYQDLTYSGETAAVTARIDTGVLEGDTVNVTVTGGDEKDAGSYTAVASIDNGNYKLTHSEQAYTIAQAAAQIAIPEQTIRATKTSEQLAAQIGAVQAQGVNGEKIDGVLTVTEDISGYAAGATRSVGVSFTHSNGNYVSPVNGSVTVTFTQGDPQTVTFAKESLELTYGDTGAANAASVAVGTGTVTYSSSDEQVVTVADDGSVTVVGVGTATVTATASADGDWAATSVSYPVTVAPKEVSITGVAVADKVYDGTAAAVLSEDSVISAAGVLDGDDVTVDASKAAGTFADVNAGANKTVAFTGFALTGEDAANYVLSGQPTAAAAITKADPVITLSGLTQYTGSVTAVTAEVAPASEGAVVVVEYKVVDTPAGEGQEAVYKWTTEVPTQIGTYEVRAYTEGDGNLNAVTADNAVTGTLTVTKASSGGGGGGGSSSYSISDSTGRSENGSISLSRSSASAGTKITITVKPDTGYELDTLKVTDKNGSAVKLTSLGDNKYSFVMPSGKVDVKAAFIETEEEEEPSGMPFLDVRGGAWYYDAVETAYEKGLMAGTSDRAFSPDQSTTRGMIVTILYSLEGKPAAGSAPFADVASGQWYASPVAWAAANGVVSGYDADTFGPNDPVTREQLAVILYSYAKLKGYDVSAEAGLSAYADAGQISAYAVGAVSWAVSKGLISGVSANELQPLGLATRAQIATILVNFDRQFVK